jgi:Flp pilus assembly protein TadB
MSAAYRRIEAAAIVAERQRAQETARRNAELQRLAAVQQAERRRHAAEKQAERRRRAEQKQAKREQRRKPADAQGARTRGPVERMSERKSGIPFTRGRSLSGPAMLWLVGATTVAAVVVGLTTLHVSQDAHRVKALVLIVALPLLLIGLAWWLWRVRKFRHEVNPVQTESPPMPEEGGSCAGCVRATRIAARTGHRVDCLRCGRSLTS